MTDQSLEATAREIVGVIGDALADEWTTARIVKNLIPILTRLQQTAHHAGANWMLDEIRYSLREFPKVGGDIEIKNEVDRLLQTARAEGEGAMRDRCTNVDGFAWQPEIKERILRIPVGTAFQEAIAAAERRGLRDAAKIYCACCEDSDPDLAHDERRDIKVWTHFHENDFTDVCDAPKIWDRIAEIERALAAREPKGDEDAQRP